MLIGKTRNVQNVADISLIEWVHLSGNRQSISESCLVFFYLIVLFMSLSLSISKLSPLLFVSLILILLMLLYQFYFSHFFFFFFSYSNWKLQKGLIEICKTILFYWLIPSIYRENLSFLNHKTCCETSFLGFYFCNLSKYLKIVQF